MCASFQNVSLNIIFGNTYQNRNWFIGELNSLSLQINLEGLAVNTILHSHHVNDFEGVSTVSLDTINKQVTVQIGFFNIYTRGIRIYDTGQ